MIQAQASPNISPRFCRHTGNLPPMAIMIDDLARYLKTFRTLHVNRAG